MKKTIRELIAECGLVPSDIVKLSDGRLSIGQASVWLRDFKLSMPAELLLEWYCQRKVDEGVGPMPAGRKKGVMSLVTPDIEQMAAIRGDYDKAAMESVLVPASALSHKDMDVLVNGGPEKAKKLVAEAKKPTADIKKEIPGLKNCLRNPGENAHPP